MAKTKSQIINEFQINANDTGSIELQIALMTDRIVRLTQHFKKNAKDQGSKRGMLVLIGRRRRFLRYMQEKNQDKYKELIERLGLRK